MLLNCFQMNELNFGVQSSLIMPIMSVNGYMQLNQPGHHGSFQRAAICLEISYLFGDFSWMDD